MSAIYSQMVLCVCVCMCVCVCVEGGQKESDKGKATTVKYSHLRHLGEIHIRTLSIILVTFLYI